jgi:hypothetical protein
MGSVGATFQLGAKLGVDRCGVIEKTSVIPIAQRNQKKIRRFS